MNSVSRSDVARWVNRVEEVTEAIQDILQEDPVDAMQRKAIWEAKQREEKERLEKEKLAKVKIRYEPKYYNRFERDDVIDAMLKEVDLPPGTATARYPCASGSDLSAHFSKAEMVSLKEAQRLKEEAFTAVRSRDWARAEGLYTGAIRLQPIDESLLTVLHNNRALVMINLRKFLEALEDASFVLRREPDNAKALLRRAVALRQLHRPVEALEDVTHVLRLEPKNAEALVQHAWLRRAELELLEGNRFLEAEALKQTGSQASQAVSLLSLSAAEGEGAFSVASMLSLVGVLRDVLEALHRGGTGACVVFANRGGLPPVVSLARHLLCMGLDHAFPLEPCHTLELTENLCEYQQQTQLRDTLLLQLLRVLAAVWDGSEIATQEIPVEAVEDFVRLLVKRLARALHCSGPFDAAGKRIKVAESTFPTPPGWLNQCNAILQCLASLTARYFTLVQSAVEGFDAAAGGLLPALWDSPYFQTSITGNQAWVLLYYFMAWLNVLLEKGASSQKTLLASERSLWGQLCGPHSSAGAGEDKKSIVLDALMRVFGHAQQKQGSFLSGSMEPLLQSAAAALALRLTSVTTKITAKCIDCESVRLTFEELSSKAFTASLHDVFHTVFSRVRTSSSLLPSTEDSRLLEALYAVVYNLVLLYEPREVYVKQWLTIDCNQGEPTCITFQALNYLAVRGHDGAPCFTPLSTRMLGVLVKFLTAGDTVLRSRLCCHEWVGSDLWKWMAAAVGVLRNAFESPRDKSNEVVAAAAAASVGEQEAKTLAWEHLEHLTTILATLLKQDNVVELEHIDLLMNLVTFAPLQLTEVSVHAMMACASETDKTQQQLSGLPIIFSVASVVAVGNAALLISMLSFSRAEAEIASGLLLRLGAVDVLLQAIRDARSSAHVIAREIAEVTKQRQNLTDVLSYLRRWHTHLKAAAKNLAIAISRVCAIGGAALKDRLRELNGFETLLAIQGDK